MDGLKQVTTLDGAHAPVGRTHQQTLKSAISCVGIGVHTGRRTAVTLRPTEANHGIVFHRTDLNRLIPATYDRVTDTRLSTVIADPEWASARVGTIEHLMAAFAAKGIDNALVEVDGPELPILDGSAAPFLFLLDCAGTETLAAPRRVIEIRRTVRVTDGDAFAELRPLGAASRGQAPVLDLEVSIDFAAEAIGQQTSRMRLDSETFRNDFARARTFAQAHEIDALREAGFALGGSLENAVVVDGARVLNPGGLRMEGEFVRHKLVDAIGDLALAGAALHGRFIAHRTGHALNNKLLRALFAKSATWARADAEPLDAVAA